MERTPGFLPSWLSVHNHQILWFVFVLFINLGRNTLEGYCQIPIGSAMQNAQPSVQRLVKRRPLYLAFLHHKEQLIDISVDRQSQDYFTQIKCQNRCLTLLLDMVKMRHKSKQQTIVTTEKWNVGDEGKEDFKRLWFFYSNQKTKNNDPRNENFAKMVTVLIQVKNSVQIKNAK